MATDKRMVGKAKQQPQDSYIIWNILCLTGVHDQIKQDTVSVYACGIKNEVRERCQLLFWRMCNIEASCQ